MLASVPSRAGDRPRTTTVALRGLIPPTAVMLYAPRERAGLDVIEGLLRAAHAFARPA
jgi:hypothetical protein